MLDQSITHVGVRYHDESDGWELIGFNDDQEAVQIIGSDAGEAEDKMLVRDLSWVVDVIGDLLRERAFLLKGVENRVKLDSQNKF